jgi:hypothetical protein
MNIPIGSSWRFPVGTAAKCLIKSSALALLISFLPARSLEAGSGGKFSSEVIQHFYDIVSMGKEENASELPVGKWNSHITVFLSGRWDRRSEKFIKDIAAEIENRTGISVIFSDVDPNFKFHMERSMEESMVDHLNHLNKIIYSDENIEQDAENIRNDGRDLGCWSNVSMGKNGITGGYAFVKKSHFRNMVKYCISLSFFNVIGILGVADEHKQSLLNGHLKMPQPAEIDYRALEVLYSDEVKIGMSRDEARRALIGEAPPDPDGGERDQPSQGFRFLPAPRN